MPNLDGVAQSRQRKMVELSRLALALAYHYGAKQDSEDIAQEALLSLLEAESEIRSPKTWLRTVVRRKCAQLFAEKERRRQLAERLPRDRSPMGPIEWELAVKEAFAEVSERDRQLLALKLAGCTYAEIADHTGLPVDSVGTWVSRAFKHARRVLAA